MKKRIKTRKFKRTSNERKQLFRNLISSLVQEGFIVTSEAKAKTIRPMTEKLVTLAKVNSLATLRELTAKTGKVDVAKGLLEIGALFVNRPGGYLRLIRLASQSGDDTQQMRVEWVEKVVKPEIVIPPKKEIKATEVKTIEPEPKKTVNKRAPKKAVQATI